MTFPPFRVQVPASSANLGPGFDALGMAVDIVNTIGVEPAGRWELILTGEGAERLPAGERNLLFRSVITAAQRWSVTLPPARLRCHNVIPLSRGLGSSSAAIVGGVTVAARLSGEPHEPDELLRIASEIEGHPDNVTPALLGGIQACAVAEGHVLHVRVPLARPLRLAMFVPDVPMPTREARRVIPKRVDLHDAVFNVSRGCLLVAALAAGEYGALRVATQDMLHQPARARLFPAMSVLFHAALEAGALGVFLSGAGSTVMALVDETDDPERIAASMAEAAARDGAGGRASTAAVRETGATVELA
ncbi:MAG: homoserine kinase [Chloroflexota bacterium]|jgi:homoserine kinase|nr:homoserine kinase [Chloroflexota bacterium]